MIEHNIDISTDDGQMATFITHPESGGPHPVVLFLIDAPGKREELHDMARRISATGYYVVLSNLYYRDARSFTVHREDPASAEHMFSLMANLDNRLVAQDATAMLAHAEADAVADTSRVGVTGYCMSGPFALWIAATMPMWIGRIMTGLSVRLKRQGPMPIVSGAMVLPMVLCFPTEPCSTKGRQNVTGNCCTACLIVRSKNNRFKSAQPVHYRYCATPFFRITTVQLTRMASTNLA